MKFPNIKQKGILYFSTLATPKQIGGQGDPKYSASLLIHESESGPIQKIIDEAKANVWPKGFPHNGKLALLPAAEKYPKYADQLNGYNVLTMYANSEYKPVVVDANRQPLLDFGELYMGAEVWVALTISTYNEQVNKGVGAYINGLMLTGKEGALGRLQGGRDAESMFADVEVDTTNTDSVAPAAPAAPTPPVAPAPQFIMTEKAQGATYDAFVANGWTDTALIEQGYMLPPGGVTPSFSS